MPKPSLITVATSVFVAGIVNAFIYTLGYLAILILQFALKDGGGGTFASAVSSLIVTLLTTLLLSGIITFLLAFPIAAISRSLGWIGVRAFLIAPAIGAALACAIASLLGVQSTTYLAIVSFAYITAACMWLMLRGADRRPS